MTSEQVDPTVPGTGSGSTPVPEDADGDTALMAGVTDTSKEDSDDPVWMGHEGRLELPVYDPVQSLITKMENWLVLQPEWAIILSRPRATRRKAITLMAKTFVTIPTRRKF